MLINAQTSIGKILKERSDALNAIISISPKFEKLMTFRRNSQAKDAELKAILTPQQYSLYEQKKDEMEDKIKQKIVEKHQAAQ